MHVLLLINLMMYLIIFILGSCLGSFINVVIIRLPKMLDYSAKKEAYAILGIKKELISPGNLLTPSACPNCHEALKPWHNIPIISYLWLKGKCRFCNGKISLQYPIIEFLSGLLCVFTYWYFGITWIALALSVLWLSLLALSMIDIKYFVLPDHITLPLLWLGLLFNSFNILTSLYYALWGAVVGYLTLWISYWAFKLITKKEGFGYGDFKLLAVLGAFFGIESLLFIIIASTAIGLLFAAALYIITRQKQVVIPFGPALSIAGFIYPLTGQKIMHYYLIWLY